MSYRFYPRAKQSRTDSLIGPDHVSRHGPHQVRSRRDGLAQSIGPGDGGLVMAVTVTGGNSLGVKSLVAGGSAILFTVTGQDRWADPIANVNVRSMIVAGLATGFNVSSLIGILASSGSAPFSLDSTGALLNVVLPPIAAFSPGASTSFDWTFPEGAFKNRAGSLTVGSAFVVSSAA